MHPVNPGTLQVAAEPPGWLLRNSALAETLPWEELGTLRPPTGVERLLARTGKRLRESLLQADTPSPVHFLCFTLRPLLPLGAGPPLMPQTHVLHEV